MIEEADIIITAKDIVLEPYIKEDDRTFKETMVNNLPPEQDENKKKKNHGKIYKVNQIYSVECLSKYT